MPPTLYPIDPEWGEGLVGLRIAVPLSWWHGYSSTDICLDKIAKFDPTESPPFLLGVKGGSGNFYAMRYKLRLKFAFIQPNTNSPSI